MRDLLLKKRSQRSTDFVPLVELILKFSTPYRLTSGSISKRITGLNHKPLNDSVEYKVIIVSIPTMGGEILNCSWALIWIQSHVDISESRVHQLQKQKCQNRPAAISSYLLRLNFIWGHSMNYLLRIRNYSQLKPQN